MEIAKIIENIENAWRLDISVLTRRKLRESIRMA